MHLLIREAGECVPIALRSDDDELISLFEASHAMSLPWSAPEASGAWAWKPADDLERGVHRETDCPAAPGTTGFVVKPSC